jgi:hypothetical protein
MLILFLSLGLGESRGEPEKIFYGKTNLKIPTSINLAYQRGPYFLTDLNAVIDVYPKSASRFVNIEIKPPYPSLSPTYTTTFQGMITVDSEIPSDMIFLSLYYTAKDNRGAVYKSSWTDSSNPIMIKRMEKSNKAATNSQTDNYFSNTNDSVYLLKHKQYEYFIPYEISSGEIQNVVLDCSTASILMHLDKVKTGNLTISIPKKMLDDEGFIVLADGEEVSIQTQSDTESRTLFISLENNKVVEIIAAHYVSQMPQNYPVCGSGDLRSPYYRLLTPTHQFKSGIPVTQIQCNEGLVFLIKPNIRFGGCFIMENVDKMYGRGWSTPSGSMGVFQ